MQHKHTKQYIYIAHASGWACKTLVNKWPLATQELPCFAFECVALVSKRSECVQQVLAKSVATTSSCHTELELALILALSVTENYTEHTSTQRTAENVCLSHTASSSCGGALQSCNWRCIHAQLPSQHHPPSPNPSQASWNKSSWPPLDILCAGNKSFLLLLPQKCIPRVLAIFCETKASEKQCSGLI